MHQGRRNRLFDRLGDGLLLLPTAAEAARNGDVQFEFRPGSDFHYLTGFPESGAVLAAWRTGRDEHHSVLFVQPRDREREIWNGRRFGTAGARRRFGVDEAFPIGELWQRLPRLLEPQRKLFWRLGADAELDRRLLACFAKIAFDRRRRQPPAHPTIQDPTPALAELRLRKDAAELAAMRLAAAATVAGHAAAMAAARPGMREYEVQVALEGVFRSHGSPRNGYPSIVASGPNACILHYNDNDRRLRDGELILIDAGAEIQGVTADVTRTFPVSGRFSAPQAAVYRAVLRAQAAGIRACRPGAAWDAPHKACQRVLTRGLIEFGVLRGEVAPLVRKEAFKPWYMHGTTHWLGRDVHDVGAYVGDDGRPAPMPRGAVLTVEPGLYFDARDKRVPAELRGIGVRIEDDILVGRDGPVVLTEAAPKSIADVERACAAGNR
ncbi:MAG: aminopeptidase P N-terminal domain-containing protein [Planctomycetes bacterium]|nr:aminopeptidase P N-terminal domain-containing protein [Planctomycetota bacterium]